MKNTMPAPGVWNFICDICGEKWKSKDAKRTWDGFIVCPECYSPKHPQIEIRGVRDSQAVPWTRPDVEIELTSAGVSSLAVPNNEYIDLIYLGTTDSVSAGQLIDTDADFVTAGVEAGDMVWATNYSQNAGWSGEKAVVTSVEDLNTLNLDSDIFKRTGVFYKIRRYSARITQDDL